MLDLHTYLDRVFAIAAQKGYTIERSARNGLPQIDFGHKKLHEGHLTAAYPHILAPGADISAVIRGVAPGRPCAHRPMKEIIERLHGMPN